MSVSGVSVMSVSGVSVMSVWGVSVMSVVSLSGAVAPPSKVSSMNDAVQPAAMGR